jgi:Glycosyltransferase Family 4
MRIALFTETFLPKVDGIVTRLSHTVDHLQRLGNQVLVISPDGGLTEYKGAKIYGIPGFPLPLYPELKLALPRPSMRQVLESFQPDLMHLVNPAVLVWAVCTMPNHWACLSLRPTILTSPNTWNTTGWECWKAFFGSC